MPSAATTTTRAVKRLLGVDVDRFPRRSAGSFLAIELLRIPPWRRAAVLEIGIDAPGQMKAVARLVRPDMTVVTSIGNEHITSMQRLEVTRREKAELLAVLRQGGLAVLNRDDPNVLWMARRTKARVTIVVLGEMTEPRRPRSTAFRLKGERVARTATHAIFMGSRRICSRYVAGARQGGMQEENIGSARHDIDAALELLPADLGPNDVIPVKGSPRQRLERISFQLTRVDVRCRLQTCFLAVACEHCPHLRTGVDDLRTRESGRHPAPVPS